MSRPNHWKGKQCIVPGCEDDVDCRGLCKKHYTRALRGSLDLHPRPSFVQVTRAARAEAAIMLVNAGLLPKTIKPDVVAAALRITTDDLQGALNDRQRKKKTRAALPRVNVDRATAPAGQKWCSQCKRFRPIVLFHRDKNGVDGHSHICKTCKNAHQRKYRARLAKAKR